MLGKFWDQNWAKISFAFGAFLGALLLVRAVPWDNNQNTYLGDFNTVKETQTYSPPAPPVTPSVVSRPPEDYKPSDIVYDNEGVWLDQPHAYQITWWPVYLGDSWWWPAMILWAPSVYEEGSLVFLQDAGFPLPAKTRLLPIPEKPALNVGDWVVLDFNFVPRQSPAGLRSLQDGNAVIVGGIITILKEGPQLGPDNHWWCQVKVLGFESFIDQEMKQLETFEKSIPSSWIPCEVQPFVASETP